MAEIADLHESVDVAAPPERVWALVTDLPRMASWSPQGVRTFVRGRVGLGTRALNINRSGWKVWPTRSTVVRFDPHRDFAFRIKDNGVIWSYGLEPTVAGTRVTHRRETPDGILPISLRLQDAVLGGVDRFTGELRDGMRQTLGRIKAEAEG
ncbi:SRPBCC family protein [Nocardioides sp. GXQ0305]|uniref:SRPBCC family protein n=1 Tax=Nocardioides sp. GXQ0305 TaxID=3423912 RepID=UPI003D7C4C4C